MKWAGSAPACVARRARLTAISRVGAEPHVVTEPSPAAVSARRTSSDLLRKASCHHAGLACVMAMAQVHLLGSEPVKAML